MRASQILFNLLELPMFFDDLFQLGVLLGYFLKMGTV
jgi:hypothetical protein